MKKGFRKLNDDERKLAEKVMLSHEEELSHLKLLVKYNKFMLDEMLYSNYLEKRRAFGRQNREYEDEIKTLENNIATTKKQLKDGIKENSSQKVNNGAKTPSMVR